MDLIEKLETNNLIRLRDSDQYGRIYNNKEEYMPLPREVISRFVYEPTFVKIGSPTIAQTTEGQGVETFSTYILEKKFHDNEVMEGFSGTVGILVNNSQNKLTVYSGAMASACLNLSIFGAEYLQSMALTFGINNLTAIVESAQSTLLNRLVKIKELKENLEKRTYTSNAFQHRKGEILSRMPLNLIDYVKHAELVMRDANTIYSDMPDSDWKLLSAFTDKIKHESPTKRIQSTLALEELFS